MYSVRKCSNFILLHVTIELSHNCLLKRLSLPPVHILAPFVKNKVPISAWVYFWAFSLVPLVYISVLCQYHTVLMTVALQCNLKAGSLIPPAPFFFFKIALALWGLSCFHMNYENFCSSSVKKCHCNLTGIALDL